MAHGRYPAAGQAVNESSDRVGGLRRLGPASCTIAFVGLVGSNHRPSVDRGARRWTDPAGRLCLVDHGRETVPHRFRTCVVLVTSVLGASGALAQGLSPIALPAPQTDGGLPLMQ